MHVECSSEKSAHGIANTLIKEKLCLNVEIVPAKKVYLQNGQI